MENGKSFNRGADTKRKKGRAMRRILVGIILLLGTVACFGETVLLYIGDGEMDEETFEIYLPLVRAVEDGVMNEFFNSGHIIFNNGISADAEFPEPPFDAERLPLRMAKSGGACYLLEVKLSCTGAEENDPDITSAEYRFSHVLDGRVLRSDSVDEAIPAKTEFDEPEQRWYGFGKEIAQGSLAIW